MKQFLESLNDFIGVDNYFTFFENEEVDGSGPWMVSDIVFGFTYIKLLDGALKHSKEDVLREFEMNRNSENLKETLLETAVYPSGETLGFYNTTKYDLDKLCENGIEITCKLNDYIDGFSDNVKAVFDKLEFEKVVEFLDKTKMTYDVLLKFNEKKIDENAYSSYDDFMKIFSDFIRNMWDDEIYRIGRDTIANYDVFSSYHYIHEAVAEYGSFLNQLLLIDENFENDDEIKIYDPDSSGTYILEDAKDSILKIKKASGHHNGNVEIYGKSKRQENEIIYLAKKSVSKKDPYEIEGATILDVSEDILALDEIDGYDDFDLIISNYLYNDLTEYKAIFEIFKKAYAGNTKMVIALNDLNDFIEDISEIIKNDNLESLISYKNHYIIIANLNKSKSKKGLFLLIDGSDSKSSDDIVKRENKEAFSNNEYDIINSHNWKILTKSDKDKMKTIVNSYQSFEDSVDSILIKNEEYNEEMIRILLN